MNFGENRCVLGKGRYSGKSAFQVYCVSEIALITLQKTDWQLLIPQTFIYLKIGTVQGPGRIIYYPFSEIYCVFIYSLLANHFFTAIWRTAAGIGREFILSVQWNHQENFSCGADTSQSELCFWIEISNSVTVRKIKQFSDDNSFLPRLGFKQLHDSEKYPTNFENKKKRKKK